MRPNRARTTFACGIVCMSVMPVVPVWSQALSPSNSTAITQPVNNTVNDIFMGKGSRGPYVLSWKNIESGSEIIILSGRKLMAGVDYSIDNTSGTVAFSEPLPQDSVARITYKVIPGKSTANQGGTFNLPLSLQLMNSSRGSLNVMGFYRGAGTNSSGQGTSVVGIGGGLKFGSISKLDSQLFIGQGDDAKGAKSLGDRSAMKFGTSTALGGMTLNASFLHVGQNFAGSNEYGFQKGKQLLDLSGGYGKTTDGFYASLSYKQQDDLTSAQKGATQTDMIGTVGLNLPTNSKLSLTHSQSGSDKPGSNGTVSTLDLAQLDQKLGDKTMVTTAFQRNQSGTSTSKTETNTTRFGIQSSAISNTQFRGSWVRKDMGKSGDETALDFGLKASAGKKTTLDAAYSSLDSAANGQQTMTSMRMMTSLIDAVQFQGGVQWKDSSKIGAESAFDMSVNASPIKQLSIGASHSEMDSDQNGQTAKTDVKMVVKPIERVDLTGDYSSLDAPNNAGLTSAGVKLAAKPIDNLKIEASAHEKLTDVGNDELQKGVRLETQPVDFLKLSGGLSQLDSNTSQKTNTDAKIELTPSKRLKLAHSYSSEVAGASISTVKDYAGSVKPMDFIEVSGGYKTRQHTGADDIDSTAVKLALDPLKALNLTGQYLVNPEDPNGIVQALESRSLGVNMKLGVIGISGAYTQKLEYVIGRTSEEKAFGLRVKMFGNGLLNTGYKLSSLMGGLQQDTETYSLGYTHDIGAAFNLSLAGELVRCAQDAVDQKDEYKATAKLGMKF